MALTGCIQSHEYVRCLSRVPHRSDELIAEFVGAVDRVGYAIIPDYVGRRDLEQLRGFAEDAVLKADNEYACFTGPAELAYIALERMANSLIFRRLCTRIYEYATGSEHPISPTIKFRDVSPAKQASNTRCGSTTIYMF